MTIRDPLHKLTAIGLAFAAGFLVAAPALGRVAVLGARNNDLDGALWYRWYLLDSLKSGRLPDTTPMVAYPIGTDMLVRDGCNLLDALLSLPLLLALGPFAAHDAWAVLLVAGNWLAFSWASRAWLPEGRAGFWPGQLGAALFALSPIAIEELGNGRVTQAFLIWLALLLREVWLLDRSRWAWARGGLWLALTGLTYWYAAVWGGTLAALVGLSRSPKKTAAMLALSLLLVAPMLLAYAARVGELGPMDATQKHMFVLWWDGGTALLGPGRDVGLDPVGMGRLLGVEFVPGVLALSWLAWRERGPWIPLCGAAALWLAFALGPQPFDLFKSPLYTAALWLGPLAQRLWFPMRSLVILALALAAALSAIAARIPESRRWMLVVALLAWPAALYAQGSLPLQRWEPPQAPSIAWLAAQPAGAVIALPHSADSTWRAVQIQHGKPVQLSIGGDNPALAVPAWEAWARTRPAMGALDAIAEGRALLAPLTADSWAQLRADGFDFVLLDREKLRDLRGESGLKTTLTRLKKTLGKPAEADDRFLVWRLPEAAPR